MLKMFQRLSIALLRTSTGNAALDRNPGDDDDDEHVLVAASDKSE